MQLLPFEEEQHSRWRESAKTTYSLCGCEASPYCQSNRAWVENVTSACHLRWLFSCGQVGACVKEDQAEPVRHAAVGARYRAGLAAVVGGRAQILGLVAFL
ncbi:hypothetical protein SKAU_G00186430 [Synaphobranchus kaupii]|uniref:Uncharacterized protein n=1 Tax=Synaphobranchus kaupii TaxID=118154 RepID=A0A9Q1FCT6_SYNKA|nr:hypothetical protein SKAU_G00186430 [Synaphobranchus kaupii]